MKNLFVVVAVLVIFFLTLIGMLKDVERDVLVPEYVYIEVTRVVEVPVIVEKEKVLVFFGNQEREQEVYTPIPQPTMTEDEIRSGVWTDLPFDQNNDGTISCLDFKGSKLGLDNLLNLAYNRYNMIWLDSNGDNVPCNE